jgi:hypothetical protein
MSCDPLFEDCPVADANQDVVVEDVDADKEEKSGSPVEMAYGIGFGVAMLFGAYSGFSLDWLKSEIEADTTRYPADVAGTRVFDQTWATNAKEPTAWAQAGTFMLASYSVSFLLWALNFGLGGNGGLVHRSFYRFSQVFALVPFFNLV